MHEDGRKEAPSIRPRSDLTMKLVEERNMTDTEIEAVASLLFTWWKREFEQQSRERLESNLREQ